MPKFRKEIVRTGRHFTVDAKGVKHYHTVDDVRVNHWIDSFRKLKGKGYSVPAPSFHDGSVPVKDPKSLADSKTNFGFWDDLTIEDSVDRHGKPCKALFGVIEVPLQADADRLKNTVKETSIVARPEFLDDDGEVHKDVITHIACCTNAVEPNQTNFQELENGGIALSMSQEVANDFEVVDGSDVNTDGDVFSLLDSVAGVVIPKNTPIERLLEALRAALLQKKKSEKNDERGSIETPPTNSSIHGVPVLMSNNQAVPGNQAKKEVIPPDNKVETDLVMSHPSFVALQQTNTGLLNMATQTKKQELKTRLSKITGRGVIGKEQGEALDKQIDSLTMAFDGTTGNIITPVVETQIQTLEMVALPQSQSGDAGVVMAMKADGSGGYQIADNPLPNSSDEVTDERAKSIVDGLFARAE